MAERSDLSRGFDWDRSLMESERSLGVRREMFLSRLCLIKDDIISLTPGLILSLL